MRLESCAVCLGSGIEPHPATRRAGRPLFRCRSCGLVAAEPSPRASDATGFPPAGIRRDPRCDTSRATAVSRLLGRGRILEIGCGAGYFLAALHNLRFEAHGLEENPALADEADRRLKEAGSGVRIHRGGLESADLSASSFDLIAIFGALAHATAPRTLLMRAAGLLRDGGYLLIETHDAGSWTARLLASRWAPLRDPDTVHIFGARSIARLVTTCGLLPETAGTRLRVAWPHIGLLIHLSRKSAEPIKVEKEQSPVVEVAPLGATQ